MKVHHPGCQKTRMYPKWKFLLVLVEDYQTQLKGSVEYSHPHVKWQCFNSQEKAPKILSNSLPTYHSPNPKQLHLQLRQPAVKQPNRTNVRLLSQDISASRPSSKQEPPGSALVVAFDVVVIIHASCGFVALNCPCLSTGDGLMLVIYTRRRLRNLGLIALSFSVIQNCWNHTSLLCKEHNSAW